MNGLAERMNHTATESAAYAVRRLHARASLELGIHLCNDLHK
jgi:hypothetical protein